MGMMLDSLKIDGEMSDEKQKIICNSNKREWQKHSEWVRIAGLSKK